MANRLFRGESHEQYKLNEGVLTVKQQSNNIAPLGISTTPDLDRAIHYATSGGKEESGVIYCINPDLFEAHQVEAVELEDAAAEPKDQEVILITLDNGPLPADVISQTRRTPSLLVEYNFCGIWEGE